jgi:hypothetical protein
VSTTTIVMVRLESKKELLRFQEIQRTTWSMLQNDPMKEKKRNVLQKRDIIDRNFVTLNDKNSRASKHGHVRAAGFTATLKWRKTLYSGHY